MHLAISVVQNPGGLWEVNKVNVFANKLRNNLAYIGDLGKSLEQRDHLEKATVVGVVIPGEDWHGILVVEVVCVR